MIFVDNRKERYAYYKDVFDRLDKIDGKGPIQYSEPPEPLLKPILSITMVLLILSAPFLKYTKDDVDRQPMHYANK